MPEAHLEFVLGPVDPGHARFEMGAMGLPHPKDLVDPGMDHLVGQGAQGGFPGQGLQQWLRKDDLAEAQPIGPLPSSVEARCAGQSAATPAQVGHWLARTHKGTCEMFAVQPVEQGQQGLQGHGIRCGAPLQGKASLGPGDRTAGSSVRLKPLYANVDVMDWGLARDYGSKGLLAGAGALLLYWTISAVKLVLSARGINPLIKQFFTQVASGQIDGAYLLTTKNYRSHVNRQQFIRFLAGLKLNNYRNLKSGRPRMQEDQVILTVKLKADGSKDELPLDFTFVKVEDAWRIDRIQATAAS
jgi:hypothetical protein